MDAILRVDDELGLALLLADDLIHPRRAIALRGLVIERQIIFDRDRRVLELKLAGLVFLVIGVREEHGRETIEGQQDRKSIVQGKSGTVRVELGGRRSIKKNN